MADNLTWLARNAHLWPEIVPGRAFAAAFTVEGSVKWLEYPPVDWDGCYQKHEWLARRSELQNKPSWKDAPQDASYLAQEPHGMWTFFFDRPYESPKLCDDGWRFDGFKAWCSECRGEVLGDWRDSLERRPVDLSEPAVTARLTEATENVLAAAPELVKDTYKFEDCEDMIERIYWEFDSVRAKKLNPERDIFKRFVRSAMVHIGPAEKLIRMLTTSPDNFTASELVEIHQLADAELTKRDAAVCGGEGYLNNHWFERGELPPVGIECTAVADGIPDANCIIFAISTDQVVVKWIENQMFDVLDMPGWSFRPIRTERDKAIDEMKQHCPHHESWDTVGRIYAEALYDAGYRK